MATTELPQPGVSVIQQFRTVSPTITTPTLVPCVVGPCYQVVPALETDATGNSIVNTDAVPTVPPIITSGTAGPYTGLDGQELKVEVNGGIEQVVTFSDPLATGLTAAQAVSQILATSGLTGWTAVVVTQGASTYLQLQGTTSGDNQSLKVTDGDANANLDLEDFFEATGFSSYTQDKRFIDQSNFPDPRSNIDELDIDEDSIRVFLNTGSVLEEIERDETFLRNGYVSWVLGSAITFAPSGTTSMDAQTLLLTLETGGSVQTITFDGDFWEMDGTLVVPTNAYADPGTDTIQIQKNNDSPVLVTFASPVDIDAAVVAINAAWAATYTGEAVCYRGDVDGSVNAAGLFVVFQVGGATATGDYVKVIEPAAGNAFVDIGFTSGQGSVHSSLVYFINLTLNSTTGFENAEDGGSDKLKLVSYDGYILVDKDGTANATLGFSTSADTEQYAMVGVDDGDGDTKSPLIRIHNEDFTLDPNAAQTTGTAVLTAANQVHKLTFQVALDGLPMQEIEFNGGPIVASNSPYADPGTDKLGMIVNGTPVVVTFASPADIAAAITAINTAAGQTVCYRSLVDGTADVAGTYISFQVGGATDAGGEIVMDYSASTGNAWTDIGFTGTDDIYQTLTAAEIETAIDATMGAGFSTIVSTYLQLDSAEVGAESKIEIGQGTANTLLGFTAGAVVNGREFKPMPGDALYGDGVFIGNIVQVTPGAVSTDLRLDRELTFSTALYKYWYIQAKSIPSTLPATRPTPDLVVDLAGDITIKHDILRDTRGDPVLTASNPIVLAYDALRLDVTSDAENPALLVFEDTDELGDALEPLDTDNPLGLGLFFALLNAPSVTVAGLGVSAVSADAPDGTLAAYNKAFTFLESEEVYGVAPLTHEAVVHQALQTHVNAMSDPDARGERLALINPSMPTRDLDTLVSSGTDGDTTGVTNEFDTKVSNLAALLLAAGVDPTGTIDADEGVFLDIATDAKNYSIQSISGTVITCRVAFSPGDNDDSFYSTSNLPTPLISESFSIKVRGAQLLTSANLPDYAAIASTLGDLATAYDDRRVVMTVPDSCGASIDGLEQLIDGYYMNCALAGMIGQQPPQQGFTNFPMTGFTRVVGSNDVFSNTQMNVGAGGGVYWIIQEVAGGPLTSRHQLTTDLTSIETRELSITKVVDYTAKFMRAGLRNFIGKFNITQGFLDTLSTVIQGQLTFLSENGVIIGGDLNNIVQDTTAPDTVLIDVTLDVPYPCNYIRLTLVV